MYIRMSLAAVAIAGMATPADANTTRYFSATGCTGSTPFDNGILARFKEGCFNYFLGPTSYDTYFPSCGATATVSLAITGNNSDTVDFDTITVNYVNGNLDQRISCTAFVQNSSGTVYASSALTSSLAPNFTTSVSGTLTWTGSSLPNAGSSISNVRTQTVFCVLPSKFPSPLVYEGSCFESPFSAITSYAVDTVQP